MSVTRRRRDVRTWIVIALGVGLVALLGGAPTPTRAPFDPDSTAPDGARALVLLLRQYGATVQFSRTSPADDGAQVALVLDDRLDQERRGALARWVRAGGTLIVADPSSMLQVAAPARRAALTATDTISGSCTLPGASVMDAHRLDIGRESRLLRVPSGATACFREGGDAAFLVSVHAGAGRVVGLGGAAVFSNALLDRSDNAALALVLLTSSARRVDVLVPSPAALGSGRQTLRSLLPPGVKLALIQLLVAFGVVAAWRARRLGKPVSELQPVQIAGSQLTRASGDLLARTGAAPAAAAMLSGALRRWLGERLGLDRDVAATQLTEVASARTGVDAGRLRAVLEPDNVRDDVALLELSQSIESVRQEVIHGR